VEHVLLGFVVFNTLCLLFILWALRAGQREVTRALTHDIEEIKKRPV